MKKCIYCRAEVLDSCVIDFCEKCGINVFGRKMFDAIVQNMEEARENGDLCHNQAFTELQKDVDNFGRNW